MSNSTIVSRTQEELANARAAFRLAVADHHAGGPETAVHDAENALRAAVSAHRRALGGVIEQLKAQIRESGSYRIAEQLCREVRLLNRRRKTASTVVRRAEQTSANVTLVAQLA